MWSYVHSDELVHHGVLGMKWGIRRTKAQLARANGKSTKGDKTDNGEGSGEKKVVIKIGSGSGKGKSLSEMSDAELKERISRLEMEKKYKDLMKDDLKSSTNSGKQFVKEIVADSVKKGAKNIGGQLAGYAMGVAVNRIANAMGIDDKVVDPKNLQKQKK